MSPRLWEQTARVISTIILCVLTFIISMILIRRLNPKTAGNGMLIGMYWLASTVAFEFLAGHYLFGYAWQKLFADYDMIRGRIWL